MVDYLLLIPLAAAVGIGWALGRRERKRLRVERFKSCQSDEYFVGLNHLIDNETDQAIDSFIKALRRDSEAVPVRLALGTLFRRKGEVDRAIQLHQEVLAYSSLTPVQSLQARLALARDFLSAGLLDRAEHLLQELVRGNNKEFRAEAAGLLTDIYQREKDWEKALQTAALSGTADQVACAHFCCELAQKLTHDEQWSLAIARLKNALQRDSACVRALLMLARVEMQRRRWKAAIVHLKQVVRQDPAFASLAVPLLSEAYQHLGQKRELNQYLQQRLSEAPSTATMLLLAEMISGEQGELAAGAFITEQLKLHPSVKGFHHLIGLHLKYASSSAKDSLNVLAGLTGSLIQVKPLFRCQSCGFSGRSLHWQCPGCKQWGRVKPILGLEGD